MLPSKHNLEDLLNLVWVFVFRGIMGLGMNQSCFVLSVHFFLGFYESILKFEEAQIRELTKFSVDFTVPSLQG